MPRICYTQEIHAYSILYVALPIPYASTHTHLPIKHTHTTTIYTSYMRIGATHTHLPIKHAHTTKSSSLALTYTCTHTFFLPLTHTHTRHVHATNENSVVHGKVTFCACKNVCAHDILIYAKTHTYNNDSTL